MSDASKINASHLRCRVFVYLRQSSPRRSNTTANQPNVNMPLLRAQLNADGLRGGSRSSTKISGFLDRAL
jgi:hypothetical protein